MSGFFDKYLEVSRTTGLNLTTADLRLLIIDSADHTINPATDQYLDDIPSAARVATSGSLTGATASGKTFDASDPTFSAATGDPAEAVILYYHTGTESTSLLICYWDGLSVTPNGGDIIGTFGTPMWT
jgi:hypothetical protein